MRTKLVMAFAICATFVPCWSQQAATKPSVSDLLAKLHSKDWMERCDAYENLRSNSDALRSPKVQTALLDLLDRENREGDQKVREAQKSDHKETDGQDQHREEHGEYYSELIDTVDTFVDWSDPRQACILINAGHLPFGQSSTEAVARARVAIPCLLQISKSDLGVNRAQAIPMLVEALSKGGNTLDSEAVATAKQTIVSDLHDPDEGVRSFTVDALGRFGGLDMIPALEKVAATDPAPEVQGISIRKLAAQAVDTIKKRAEQN